jgi:nucleoside-diphosphate-sugar epimerase
MIIALTGAKGSIGKELAPFLKSLGHELITISSSIPSNGRQNFSYEDLARKQIPFVVDLFIHLASINSSTFGEKEIEQEVNITREILASLDGLKCKNLIFFSTSKVYGDNSFDLNNKFKESSSPAPSCDYGKAKKLCEDLIYSQSSSGGLNALIFRLPPVINQSKNSNIAKLIHFSKFGFPILSFVQGNLNKRSYISFNNIETVFIHVLEQYAYI